jgi:hypothetical protein
MVVEDSRNKKFLCISDEIWPERSQELDLNWMYISSLFLEEQDFTKVTNALLNARYRVEDYEKGKYDNSWQEKVDEEYFDANNEVVDFHFSRKNKFFIAKRWIELLEKSSILSDLLKVKIAGLDMNKLENSIFISKQNVRNSDIYSKFMHYHLRGWSSYFFEGKTEKKLDFIHHRGPQEEGVIEKPNDIKSKSIGIEKVQYVDDNHRSYSLGSRNFRLSQMVQLCDLLANISEKSFHAGQIGKEKQNIVEKGKKFIQEGKSYQEPAKRRISVGFFPNKEWSGHDKDYKFYQEREIIRLPKDQSTIDQYFN